MAAAVEPVAVLIVGGGPVGLALAGDLGWRGVRALLIEQSDGAIEQPRMDLVGIRSMEFCRRWGLVGEVEAAPYPRDYPQDNVYLTSLTGYELGRAPFPSMGADRPPPVSPQKRERCPQNMFDPILRRFAGAHAGVELRYRTRLRAFTQDQDGVSAEIEELETGTRRRVRARYLAGCDGARSLVRETLGTTMAGKPVLTYTTNVIFRAPHLVSLHDKGRAYRHIFVGPEGTWATIVAINGRDEWRFSLIGGAEQRERTKEEIHAAIRRAVGCDFDYEIVSIVPWIRRELVADAFAVGRAFILGDAAHVMSPTGGFGMNTGIADAVDLSWKLAAALAGWGGPALLPSFDRERRPVAVRNVTEASRNLARMLSPGRNPALLDDTPEGRATRARVGGDLAQAMSHEWHTLGMHLGYRYAPSPICIEDDAAPAPPDHPNVYVPSSHPGSRAPHAYLADGRSTLDLFGGGFTLLGFGASADAAAPMLETARRCGMPLAFVPIEDAAIAALYERRFVLVRPDGHVAWRADRMPADVPRIVERVRGAGLPASDGHAVDPKPALASN